MITFPRFHDDHSLPPDASAIFVFGSNLAGRHGAGAALVAAQRFGAARGVGAGPTGRAYAIPTKDERLRVRALDEIAEDISAFREYAAARPNLHFFVTRIGCGLAGYRNDQIAPLFRGFPDNCSFSQEWRPWVAATAAHRAAG